MTRKRFQVKGLTYNDRLFSCSRYRHLGIAMKIEDGSDRMRDFALLYSLEQLGLLSDVAAVEVLRQPMIQNHAGLEVEYLKLR
ncbi:MAG: asparaginase [Deinococcales bacterium]